MENIASIKLILPKYNTYFNISIMFFIFEKLKFFTYNKLFYLLVNIDIIAFILNLWYFNMVNIKGDWLCIL